MSRQSLIFTDAEMDAINRRMQGDKSDKTGIFSGRVKPKIAELIQWAAHKKTLGKLIAPKAAGKVKAGMQH